MRAMKSGGSAILAIGLPAWSAVAVAGQDDANALAGLVTAQVEPGLERGYICQPQQWSSDDPRLGGAATAIWHADVHRLESGPYSVTNALYDIHDDAGGWSCRNANGLDRDAGLHTTPVQGSDKLSLAYPVGSEQRWSQARQQGRPSGNHDLASEVSPKPHERSCDA